MNAVTYAETELKVHEVYDHACEAARRLTRHAEVIVQRKSDIRELEWNIALRETEILDEEWSKHPDMPVTRMDKHVKAAQLKDPHLASLHEELRTARYELDEAEQDKANEEIRARVHSARMIELGGYLQYLAEAKAAQRVRENRSTPA